MTKIGYLPYSPTGVRFGRSLTNQAPIICPIGARFIPDLTTFDLCKHPKDAQKRFFSSTGNLYTINCHFPSKYNVATSLNMSQYDIPLRDKLADSDDSTNEENPKKRLRHKNTANVV
jgi:hypothetical protein